MHKSNAKAVPSFMVFGGWKGQLSIKGNTVTITSPDRTKSLVINLAEVKKASYNSNNGLWSLKLKDGQRVRFQSAGVLLSADRTPAGQITNEKIQSLLSKHGVRLFGI